MLTFAIAVARTCTSDDETDDALEKICSVEEELLLEELGGGGGATTGTEATEE